MDGEFGASRRYFSCGDKNIARKLLQAMLNNSNNKKYLILILFVLSFVVFAKTFNYGFVWDDERIHLTGNEQLMKGDVTSFWAKPYSGMYIPLTYTTWSIVKSITHQKRELSPKAFHVLNLLTHSLNAVLIFLLLSLLFKNQAHAFWGSVLFLLHPIQVESVAWISEFRGLYSTFFSLLSMLCIFNYVEHKREFTWTSFIISKQFLIATVLFLLALLAKPSAVVLPFIIAVLVWGFYKDKFITAAKALAIWLLLIIPILLITKQSQTNELIYASVSWWQRFFIAGNSLFFYLQKIVFPFPLVACYGYTPALVVSDVWMYVGTVLCLALVVFSFIKRNVNPFLFASVSVVVFSVLPVLGFVPFEYQVHSTVADHYIYFGVLGVTLLVPSLALFVKKYDSLKYVFALAGIVYLSLTINQIGTWKNEFAVWDHTLEHYQNSPNVYYNRGVQYSQQQNYTSAISDYTQSLALQPNYLNALFNRANAYENTNNVQAAFEDYNRYLIVDSTDGSVYYKIAYLNYRTGNLTAAIADAEKSEQLNFPMANKLLVLLKEQSKTKE